MKILLTGHTGFIGSHLLKKLKDHDVVGYSLSCGDDIRDKRKLEFLFETENFDAVIHLAALTGARRGELYPDDYLSTNVIGTKNLVDLAEKYIVKRFIHFSSSSVKKHDSIYGMSKHLGECIVARSPLNKTIIRPFTVIGENGRSDQVIYKWKNKIDKKRKIYVHGLDTARNFTYVGDLTKYVASIVNKSTQDIIELCNPNQITLEELLDLFMKKYKKFEWHDIGLQEHEMKWNTGRWDSPFKPTDNKKVIRRLI